MRLALALAVLPVTACLAAPPAVVSDYNGYTVKVIYHDVPLGPNYQASPVYAEAAKVCGGPATYSGVRQVSAYQGEHTFICKR